MTGAIDTIMLEKKLGNAMASKFRVSLKSAIALTQKNVVSGKSKKATALPRFRNNHLERITMKMPYYVYPIQHYGIEGSKRRSINSRIKPTDVLNIALKQGQLTNELADGIADIRSEEVVTKISF
ncbi:hypothetical protein [Flavobacterium sp. 3HN19-14]|uniref:hypothetical protein n=1 Tax=Flavobacterium sp. 3HN19-14 TaxID=3448133 RepID=UPI003EE059DE